MTDRDRRDQGRQGHRPALLHARRPRRVRRLRRPDQVAGRASSTSSPAPTTSRPRTVAVDGVYTNKAPGGVAYRCSFRVTEAAYCIERAMDILAQKLGMDPAELRLKNLIRREQFPYTSALGWEYDSGDYHTALQQGDGGGRLQGAARGAEGEAGGLPARRDARADGHRRRLLHRDRRRRPVAQLRHPRHRDVRLRRDPHPSDRRGDRAARHQVARARATRPPTRRSSRPSSASRPTTSRSRRATPTPRPTASAPTARARRRSPAPRPRMAGAQDQGQGADDRRPPARGARRRPRMGRRPLPGEGQSGALQDHEGARLGGLSTTCRRAWSRGSRRSTTTIRPT